MSLLGDLIQADAENVPKVLRFLSDFHPDLPTALDTAAEMFRTFGQCMDGRLDDSTDLQVLEETEKELGIGEEELIELIQSSDKRKPILDRARAAWQSSEARRARVVVFLMLERYYLWAATDLLRVRLSPVLGYQRLQAESLALLFIMREEPASASRWMRTQTDAEGKAFFKAQQHRILTLVKSLELLRTYELGSGMALHVRFAGAVRGLSISKEKAGEFRLYYQDTDQEDPFSYFLEVLYFLRTQHRIFRGLGGAFPEVTDPIWQERVTIFGHTADRLWQRLEDSYPERCKRFRNMVQERSVRASS